MGLLYRCASALAAGTLGDAAAWPGKASAQLTADALPDLDWNILAEQAKSAVAYRMLVAGGLLFSLGLAWRFLQQVMRLQRGLRPDFFWPVLHLIGLIGLLSQYQRLLPATIVFVSELGSSNEAEAGLSDICLMRMQALTEFCQTQPHYSILTLTSAALEPMFAIFSARFLQMSLNGALLSLQSLQIFLLAILVQVGPLVLAFSYFGSATRTVARAWALGIVEIASWSWFLDILAATFRHTMMQGMVKDFSLAREINCSLVTLVMVIVIPFIARRLFRAAAATVHVTVPLMSRN